MDIPSGHHTFVLVYQAVPLAVMDLMYDVTSQTLFVCQQSQDRQARTAMSTSAVWLPQQSVATTTAAALCQNLSS